MPDLTYPGQIDHFKKMIYGCSDEIITENIVTVKQLNYNLQFY